MTATTAAHAFTITVTGEWIETYLPSPRHRKLRTRTVADVATVQIPVIPVEDAPLAFTIERVGATQLFRLHAGRLYSPAHLVAFQEGPVAPGSPNFPPQQRSTRYGRHADSRQQWVDAITDDYAGYRIIDGQVWEVTCEPYYRISTFGLGGNHGGTGLMTAWDQCGRERDDLIFRADDYESAYAKAVEVALNRGDTESVGGFDQLITVHLPEAVTLQIPREHPDASRLRSAHYEALQRYTRHVKDAAVSDYDYEDDVREAWADLVAAHDELLSTVGRIGRSPEQSVSAYDAE